jgi:hypothetical protein
MCELCDLDVKAAAFARCHLLKLTTTAVAEDRSMKGAPAPAEMRSGPAMALRLSLRE